MTEMHTFQVFLASLDYNHLVFKTLDKDEVNENLNLLKPLQDIIFLEVQENFSLR